MRVSGEELVGDTDGPEDERYGRCRERGGRTAKHGVEI